MSDPAKKPLILVDGSSYLYRAFHALPSLMNSQGRPTGAIYGVINMLKKLITDYQPVYMAVVFDAKGPTFRNDLYPKYKANRAQMPDELISQIAPLHQIIRALGLPLLQIEGVEADDVIGTLAVHTTDDVLISTGDKDLAQLVSGRITLVNTMSGSILTPETTREKFGVGPEGIVDYLTLTGDTSDNIPGVPNVGPKTAAKWLQQYGTLDALIENAAVISGKVGEQLRASIGNLTLSKQLVTIKLDVDFPWSLETLKRQPPNVDLLKPLFQELEFKSWLNELLANNTSAQEEKYLHYQTITTEEDFQELLAQLAKTDIVAFDTETTSLSSIDAKLVGVSFALAKGQGIYIPFGHDYLGVPPQLPAAFILEKLKPLLENPALKKIGHNLKYDRQVLANHHIHLQGIAYDTMLESYILDSAGNRHDMDSLALKYLGWRTIHFVDIAGKGVHQLTFNQIPLEKAAVYAAEDADVTLQLHQHLYPKILQTGKLREVLENIEIPLIPILARMEQTGVLIDTAKLAAQNQELQQRLNLLEQQVFQMAGKTFNLSSPKQLGDILFNELKLPVSQKTPTGQFSTADAVLQELAHDYPLPQLIIEHRALCKLISTYTKRLPEQVHPLTKRVHTSYNQTGAATGRLSSSDPNLQNIPIRTFEGRRIRQAFIAPPGHKIISADYSQIELRIMAHISQDPALLQAFANNADVHQATAAEILGIPLEEVTDEQRRSAKAINFGLVYGMSAFGLAKQIGVERSVAQHYIDRYFERYPKIKAYMDNTREQAKQCGFVETLWGRRLYLADIKSSQALRQKAAERTAINAPLQGSSADIIKLAMINIDHWLQREKPALKMIMQVHDELVFEAADHEVPTAIEKIRHEMMRAASLSVPLLVSIGSGMNWDEAAS